MIADGIVGPNTWNALQSPTPASPGAAPSGLVAVGEMELVEAGPTMEKIGPSGAGSGEATLPGQDAWKKEGGEPEAKLPEAEPWELK